MVETIRFVRRNLPHWLVADHTYFVTLRLAGTLPRSVVSELAAERNALAARSVRDEAAESDLQRRHFVRIEGILDACDHERNWLANQGFAAEVLRNLSWLEDQRG